MNNKKYFTTSRTPAGFTLIELLTVIAIIGILAGILIPTVGAVKVSAKKAKTKAQFAQWTTALSLFKQEYGYYPASVASGNLIAPQYFMGALSATDKDGNKLGSTSSYLAGNSKRLSFYSFSDSDILSASDGTRYNAIIDAFGNSSIALFLDTDGDGLVTASAVNVTPGNSVEGTGTAIKPSASSTVRSNVLFYSPGKGDSSKDIVYSWQ